MTRLNKFDASLLDGFRDGMTFADLRSARHRGPDASPGIYAVIYPFKNGPVFLPEGTGGRFKGKNPDVATSELEERWVARSRVLYLGKAGAPGESGTLHERIKHLSQFGRGRKASHWGGRLIWQIEGSDNLVVRWRPTLEGIPRRIENRLIRDFVAHYCKLPFANLCD